MLHDSKTPVAVVRQEPVGHGGFHTGALFLPDHDYRYVQWVYDCGSWRKARLALRDRIKEFVGRVRPRGRPLDLLFVSHFDTDHVNGLDRLLAEVSVDTVVIPYLEPADAFTVSVAAIEQRDVLPDPDPEWRKWLLELHKVAFDPGGWFRRRGVRRVIRIRPGSGRGAGGVSDGPLPFPKIPLLDRKALKGAPITPIVVRPDGSVLLPPLQRQCEVIIAEAGTMVGVATQYLEWTDWWFVPYVHPISNQARRDLERAIKENLRVASNSNRLSRILARRLKDIKGRRELLKLYRREELDDANGISMSLYEGPMRKSLRRTSIENEPDHAHDAGWLLTGDAKLLNRGRREEWKRFFGTRISANYGLLMLPHHGASGNFHESILDLAPAARLFITADHNDKKRPHQDVKSALEACTPPRVALKVSERPKDVLEVTSGPPSYFRAPTRISQSSSRSVRNRFRMPLDLVPTPAKPLITASDLPVEDEGFAS